MALWPKKKKYWFIRIFCASIDEEDFRGRILLATSAANVGIDNQLVTLVLCIGWCRDLCSYFYQRGQGGHDPTMQAKFLQLGSIQLYVPLMFQLYRLLVNDEDNKQPSNEVDGLHSTVSPVRKKATSRPKKQSYAPKLASHQKRLNMIQSRREPLEVILFEVLDLGCNHVCAEWFLSTGKTEPLPVQWIIYKHCMDKCGICTGAWSKTFLRVNKDSVVQFLESHHFSKEMLLIARNDTVVDVLWKGERWRIEDTCGKKCEEDCCLCSLPAINCCKDIGVGEHKGWSCLEAGTRPLPYE